MHIRTLSATSRLLEPRFMARGEAAEEKDNEPRGEQMETAPVTEMVTKEMHQTTSQSEMIVNNSVLQLDLR